MTQSPSDLLVKALEELRSGLVAECEYLHHAQFGTEIGAAASTAIAAKATRRIAALDEAFVAYYIAAIDEALVAYYAAQEKPMTNTEQRDRELLAQIYEAEGLRSIAECVRKGVSLIDDDKRALRAMSAARAEQQERDAQIAKSYDSGGALDADTTARKVAAAIRKGE